MRRFPSLGKAMLCCAALMAFDASAQGDAAAAVKMEHAGFAQKLGAQIPLDAAFTDETGSKVTLGQYFKDKPVLLTLNYYGCPMLCTLVLNGVVAGATGTQFKVGTDFDIVTISFNPRDTAALAAKKKNNYVTSLGQPGAERGWHFLVGSTDQIDRVCSAVGFSYVFDPKSGEYGHASGIMIATPQGKLSHYFYGIDYRPRDLRLALVEASQNKIGSAVDQLMVWCLHYDPVAGRYSIAVMNIIRALCITTVGCLAAFLFFALRYEFRHRQAVQP